MRLTLVVCLILSLNVITLIRAFTTPRAVRKFILHLTAYLNAQKITRNHMQMINTTVKQTIFWQNSYSFFFFLLLGFSPYLLPRNITRIQLEIMNNGPVEAVLNVYSDFMSYEKGIYMVNFTKNSKSCNFDSIYYWS